MREDTCHIKDEWIMEKIQNDKLHVEKSAGFSNFCESYIIFYYCFFTLPLISQFYWPFYSTSLNCIIESVAC